MGFDLGLNLVLAVEGTQMDAIEFIDLALQDLLAPVEVASQFLELFLFVGR